ncbi:HlyD family secretion protein [Caulobacter radicis]|uniref:HlyD family secretion protein n=1 Tax=Caulobacter radicis TaxID=2172650 RepID=UPI000D5635BA|nr:HlyD family secretion protein [Caulobacter radicis]
MSVGWRRLALWCGPVERRHHQGGQEHPRHQPEGVVEGQGGGVPGHQSRELGLGKSHRLGGVGRPLGHLEGQGGDEVGRLASGPAEVLADVGGGDPGSVAEPGVDHGDADGSAEVAHQVEQARGVAQFGHGEAARRDVERYRAAAVSAQSDADRSRAQYAVSLGQSGVTRAKRASLLAAVAQAQADVARAEATLALARQDQGHTVIVAPIDGVVGDRKVEPGDYVQPGSRLLSVVPMRALYVTANFKETQVERMVPGQAATIKVDALGGKALTGRVESFAPGSGSRFSLLPFEPGTGNFTKIVQRVPVRIRLDPGQPELAHLRPGLSTTVKVRLAG